MKKRNKIFALSSLLIFLVCCSWNVRSYEEFALIDDVTKGAASGYEIVEVDGSGVNRKEHTSIVTVVPFAIVDPGHRIFKLKKTNLFGNIEGPESLSIEAYVEAGKLYYLVRQNGTVSLIERE